MIVRRSTVAVVLLTASQVALARNAASPWQPKSDKRDAADEELTFDDFAEAIGYWGYRWQPYEVTTRDGL